MNVHAFSGNGTDPTDNPPNTPTPSMYAHCRHTCMGYYIGHQYIVL